MKRDPILDDLYRQRQLLEEKIEYEQERLSKEVEHALLSVDLFRKVKWGLQYVPDGTQDALMLIPDDRSDRELFDKADRAVRTLLGASYHDSYQINEMATIQFDDSEVSIRYWALNSPLTFDEFLQTFKKFCDDYGINLSDFVQATAVDDAQKMVQRRKKELEEAQKLIHKIKIL